MGNSQGSGGRGGVLEAMTNVQLNHGWQKGNEKKMKQHGSHNMFMDWGSLTEKRAKQVRANLVSMSGKLTEMRKKRKAENEGVDPNGAMDALGYLEMLRATSSANLNTEGGCVKTNHEKMTSKIDEESEMGKSFKETLKGMKAWCKTEGTKNKKDLVGVLSIAGGTMTHVKAFYQQGGKLDYLLNVEEWTDEAMVARGKARHLAKEMGFKIFDIPGELRDR